MFVYFNRLLFKNISHLPLLHFITLLLFFPVFLSPFPFSPPPLHGHFPSSCPFLPTPLFLPTTLFLHIPPSLPPLLFRLSLISLLASFPSIPFYLSYTSIPSYPSYPSFLPIRTSNFTPPPTPHYFLTLRNSIHYHILHYSSTPINFSCVNKIS